MFRAVPVSLAIVLLLAIACGGGNTQPKETSPPESSPAVTPTLQIPDDNRVRIPAIGVDAPLTIRTVSRNQALPESNDTQKLDDAEGPDDVAFYDWTQWQQFGGSAGQGNAMLFGKVDSGSRPCKNGTIPPPCEAVFFHLRDLQVSAQIQLFVDRQAYVYHVAAKCWVAFEDFEGNKWIYNRTDGPIATLFTGGGRFDPEKRAYSHFLVIRAEERDGLLDAACPPGSSSTDPSPRPTSAQTRAQGPTPTPERPGPSGSLILQATFDGPGGTGFASQLGRRTVGNGLMIDRRLEKGEYAVQLESGGPAAYFDGGFSVSQQAFAIEADARAEGIISKLGIGIALVNTSNNNISAQMHPTRRDVGIGRSIGGVSTSLGGRASSAMKSGTDTNRLRLEIRGTQMKIFVNDELADTITDNVLESRPLRANLGTWAYMVVEQGEDLRVFFDNVKVFSLE